MRNFLPSLFGRWRPAPQTHLATRERLDLAAPQPPMSIGEWLGEDESRWQRRWRYPADPVANDRAASMVALGLCCNSPIWWSMTARQREVFMTLGKLQLECGLHSLLPNVMEELLWLAGRTWWDAQLADIKAGNE